MSYVIIKKEKPKQKKKFLNFTLILIALNVLIFLVFEILQYIYGDKMLYFMALQPSAILQGTYLWTIFTSMFMHANVFHLFANMMSLTFLGGFIERIIGSKKFLSIYIISGLIASLFFVWLTFLFNENLAIPAVGASGAIFGIAGLAAVLVPKMKVYILFIPIAMPMWFATTFLLLVMWFASGLFGLSIGNFAHLGGFLTGVAYGFYLRKKYPRRVNLISNYFSR